MKNKLADAIVEREKTRRGERGSWESLWQSIARYCLPNSASFMEQITPGQDRMRWILDSTAPRSLEMFASFLHTLLNNPASEWVRLGVEGEPEIRLSSNAVDGAISRSVVGNEHREVLAGGEAGLREETIETSPDRGGVVKRHDMGENRGMSHRSRLLREPLL